MLCGTKNSVNDLMFPHKTPDHYLKKKKKKT